MTKAVVIRNLTKKIGSKTIVDQLTFEVDRGEVFGLLGPNGAGKTTTLRMMVGLMSITEGEVLIQGSSVTRNFEQAMRHVGAIIENPQMYRYLSGYQNLRLFAQMIPGISRKEIKERIDEVVRFVGLKKRIHEKVKTYSLGMRQRLGLAQALLSRPSVLILDEPTNGLDPAGIHDLRNHLRNLAKEEGVAVIVSSHLLSEMELMCDRVAIIQEGKLVSLRSVHSGAIQGEETQEEKRPVTVLFEVKAVERALSVLKESGIPEAVQVSRAGIEVQTRHAAIPDLNARLVEAGIGVYGIRIATKSLEQTFLEITRGSTNA